MLDIMRHLVRRKHEDHRLRPVTAPRACGAAGRQAATIADQIFSAYPDIALHKVILITSGDKGDLSVSWTWQPDSHNRIRVTNDHLYDLGVADMEETARWIAGEELRRIATLQAGPGNEDPYGARSHRRSSSTCCPPCGSRPTTRPQHSIDGSRAP